MEVGEREPSAAAKNMNEKRWALIPIAIRERRKGGIPMERVLKRSGELGAPEE